MFYTAILKFYDLIKIIDASLVTLYLVVLGIIIPDFLLFKIGNIKYASEDVICRPNYLYKIRNTYTILINESNQIRKFF